MRCLEEWKWRARLASSPGQWSEVEGEVVNGMEKAQAGAKCQEPEQEAEAKPGEKIMHSEERADGPERDRPAALRNRALTYIYNR